MGQNSTGIESYTTFTLLGQWAMGDVVPFLARFGHYTFFHSFDSFLLLRVDFIYTRICYSLLLFGYVDVS